MDWGKKWINVDRNNNRSNRNLLWAGRKSPLEFSVLLRTGMGSGLKMQSDPKRKLRTAMDMGQLLFPLCNAPLQNFLGYSHPLPTAPPLLPTTKFILGFFSQESWFIMRSFSLKRRFDPGLSSCRQHQALSTFSSNKIHMDQEKKWINTNRNNNRNLLWAGSWENHPWNFQFCSEQATQGWIQASKCTQIPNESSG